MKTKITKDELIKALKVRINSVKIEESYDYDSYLSGVIAPSQYRCYVREYLNDLEEIINALFKLI